MNRSKFVEVEGKSSYSASLSAYQVHELPYLSPLIRRLARQHEFRMIYPLPKVIRAVCKVFLLNILEFTFFDHLVNLLGWRVNDEVILGHSHLVHILINLPDVVRPQEYRSLTLFFLLTAFTVKKLLNHDMSLFDRVVARHCQEFHRVHRVWVKQYKDSFGEVRPELLNRSVERAEAEKNFGEEDELVDCLLQISPSYNPDKSFPYGVHIQAEKSFVKFQETGPKITFNLDCSRISNNSIERSDLLASLRLAGYEGSILCGGERAEDFDLLLVEEEELLVASECAKSEGGECREGEQFEPDNILKASDCLN